MLVSLAVEDVMTESVRTTTPDATARAVATALTDYDVGSLVVCDGEAPVGIVTQTDLVSLMAADAALDTVEVTAFMSADLVVTEPGESIERASELLREHDIGRLPVVHEGSLVGIVSTTDLSHYLPHLSRAGAAVMKAGRTRPEGGSTTYEDEDWNVQHHDEEADGVVGVGDRVRFSKTLSEADVERFAEASGDTNRLHLDDTFARESRFGRRIAHGVLTAGVVSAALARLPGQVVYLSQELSFLGPVDLGERVTAVCEVITDLGNNRFRLATAVYDDTGELVLDGEAVVLVDTLPEGASEATPEPVGAETD
jgi:acyl dehydratase/CBS domain-containing protein